MALDFHRLDNNEFLFGLDDAKYANMEAIFLEYRKNSGIYIDPYRDTKLTVENQKVMIKIIAAYIDKTDLNLNKQKTIDVLWFKALICYFSDKGIDIKIVGD